MATADTGLGWAGQDECAQWPPFFTATGGSGWKPLLREQSGVRGFCPLGVRTGRSQPPAVLGHNFFKAMRNHGRRQWAVEGSQVLKSCHLNEQSPAWCLGLALVGLQDLQGSCAGVQSSRTGSAEGCALPRCGKKGTGPRDGAGRGCSGACCLQRWEGPGQGCSGAEAAACPGKTSLPLWLFPLCVPSQHPPCCCTSQINAGCEIW